MDDLLKKNQRISRLFSRQGGTAAQGGIEQVLHYERDGNTVRMREEMRQNLGFWAERNRIARTLEQQSWKKGIGKEIACIPDMVVEIWKGTYAWDFDKANLKRPEDRMFFDWLLSQDEWKWLKTYDPSADSSRGHLVKGIGAAKNEG